MNLKDYRKKKLEKLLYESNKWRYKCWKTFWCMTE
jgi:hypothetical protein